MSSPILFNVSLDYVVPHWISLTAEDESDIRYGLGIVVGSSMGVFNVYDILIGSSDLEWIQVAINILKGLFQRVGLVENVEKSNTMTFQPGAIYTGMSDKAFSRRITVEGGNYRERL